MRWARILQKIRVRREKLIRPMRSPECLRFCALCDCATATPNADITRYYSRIIFGRDAHFAFACQKY